MPICPHCKQYSKRRKNGACPKCGAVVYYYRPRKNAEAIWVADEPDTNEIVSSLEELISHTTGYPFRFEDRIVELALAKRLYEKCGHDLGLALEVLRVFYDGTIPRNIIWIKNPMSLKAVIWDGLNEKGTAKGCFSAALAIARQRTREKKAKLFQHGLFRESEGAST